MEIEIPTWLYEMLLIEAAETGSAIEDIAEFCFRATPHNRPPKTGHSFKHSVNASVSLKMSAKAH